jgi:hypothetical protein
MVKPTDAASIDAGKRTWTVASQIGSSDSGGITRQVRVRRASGVERTTRLR